MSEFTKKIQDGTIPVIISKTPYRGEYHIYGSLKKFDQLVDSPNIEDRIKAAKMGYGLEKLMDDPNTEVQNAVMAFLNSGLEEE